MTIEKLIEKIDQFDLNQYDEILETADEILEKDKDNQIALGYKSYALFHQKRIDESFEVFDYALNLYPENGYLIYNKLDFLIELNRIDEALELYKEKKNRILDSFKESYESKIAKGFEKMLEANPNDLYLIDKVKNFSQEFGVEVKYDKKYYMSWIQSIKGIEDESACPVCGEKLLPIAYGYPSPETMQKAQEGKLILGGCCLPLIQKHYGCPSCKQRYTKNMAKLIIDNDDSHLVEYALKKLDEIELLLEYQILGFYYNFADKNEYDAFISRLAELGIVEKDKDDEVKLR